MKVELPLVTTVKDMEAPLLKGVACDMEPVDPFPSALFPTEKCTRPFFYYQEIIK